MFEITEGKGFKITFANGYTISVQFGSNNYCSNYSSFTRFRSKVGKELQCCANAEIEVWDEEGKWVTKKFFNVLDGDVASYITPDEVAAVIAQIVALPER